jgi:hypothetical protein
MYCLRCSCTYVAVRVHFHLQYVCIARVHKQHLPTYCILPYVGFVISYVYIVHIDVPWLHASHAGTACKLFTVSRNACNITYCLSCFALPMNACTAVSYCVYKYCILKFLSQAARHVGMMRPHRIQVGPNVPHPCLNCIWHSVCRLNICSR